MEGRTSGAAPSEETRDDGDAGGRIRGTSQRFSDSWQCGGIVHVSIAEVVAGDDANVPCVVLRCSHTLHRKRYCVNFHWGNIYDGDHARAMQEPCPMHCVGTPSHPAPQWGSREDPMHK